jgi:hypothetical protein
LDGALGKRARFTKDQTISQSGVGEWSSTIMDEGSRAGAFVKLYYPIERLMTSEEIDAYFVGRGTVVVQMNIAATNPRPEHDSKAPFEIPENHRRVKL